MQLGQGNIIGLGYGEPSKVEGKWVADETFNRVVSAVLEGADEVLDFECGSGWGLFEMYYRGVSPRAWGWIRRRMR